MGKIFVTGLTGLVGSGFLHHLILNGYDTKRMVALCRDNSDTHLISKYCTIERGSSFDENKLDEICVKYSFEMIIHISNKAQVVQFAKLAVKHNIHKTIMISSTYAVSRNSPNNDMVKYEKEAETILTENNIDYIFIRPTSIFGLRPDGKSDKNISIFKKYVIKLPLFPLFNKGKASVQPVWGRDVGQSLYICLNNFNYLKNEKYIVSGDKKRTFKGLLNIIGLLEGKKIRFICFPKWLGLATFYFIYFISFKKIDKREPIHRLLEDKAFDTSPQLIKLGYQSHSFEEGYTKMLVFDEWN